MATRRWLSLWPPVSPRIYLRDPRADAPFPLAEPGCRLYARARHGLWNGAKALGIGQGQEVLAPAYHHGCEIESLARTGARVVFYECDDELQPDAEQLEDLLTPRVRALHLVHYLGFPQDAARWRHWCDERGLYLFEDGAQSWLAHRDGRPVGSFGQLAIFCLYKSVGLGQPGALVCDESAARPKGGGDAGIGDLVSSHVGWLMQRFDARAAVGRRRYEPLAPEPDTEFELGNPDTRASAAARFASRRLGGAQVAARRRSNYRFVLEELVERVPRAFRDLPDGASPLHFPIAVRDRARFLERLSAEGVEGGEIWPLAHPSLPRRRFPRSEARRASFVGLPVHQGLGEKELRQVVEGVVKAGA